MSSNEKTNFGATFDTSSTSNNPYAQHLTPAQADASSTMTLTPQPSHQELQQQQHQPADPLANTTNPYSPFYSHEQLPPLRNSIINASSDSLKKEAGVTSIALLAPLTPSHSHRASHDAHSADPELGLPPRASFATQPPSPQVDGRLKECTVWPSKQSLQERKKMQRNKTTGKWNPMARLDKRQKLWVKILIALVVLGAATGLGVGISRAVGGAVSVKNGENKEIPHR